MLEELSEDIVEDDLVELKELRSGSASKWRGLIAVWITKKLNFLPSLLPTQHLTNLSL